MQDIIKKIRDYELKELKEEYYNLNRNRSYVECDFDNLFYLNYILTIIFIVFFIILIPFKLIIDDVLILSMIPLGMLIISYLVSVFEALRNYKKAIAYFNKVSFSAFLLSFIGYKELKMTLLNKRKYKIKEEKDSFILSLSEQQILNIGKTLNMKKTEDLEFFNMYIRPRIYLQIRNKSSYDISMNNQEQLTLFKEFKKIKEKELNIIND